MRLNLFAKTKKSPATHGSTNGQIADNGKAKFKGSKLAKFFNGSFKIRSSPVAARRSSTGRSRHASLSGSGIPRMTPNLRAI
ncbi:MAG: hypothetical protein R2686_02685 [Candidatus Nanopelagicales bacterium]